MSLIEKTQQLLPLETTSPNVTLNSGSSGSLATSSGRKSPVNTLLKKQFLDPEQSTVKDETMTSQTTNQSSVKTIMTSQPKPQITKSINKHNEQIWNLNQDQTKANEKFIVKSIHAVEPSVKSNLKTKIHPIFGHSEVRKITLERGEFPVIYIGSPCASNEPNKSKVVRKEISTPPIPKKIISKAPTVVTVNKNATTAATSTSPLPPLSSLLTHTQAKTQSSCDVIKTGTVYDNFNGSAHSEYNLQKAMNGFVEPEEVKSSTKVKDEVVTVKFDDLRPTMIQSKTSKIPGLPTATLYNRTEFDPFQKPSFKAVPLTKLTYKTQPHVVNIEKPKLTCTSTIRTIANIKNNSSKLATTSSTIITTSVPVLTNNKSSLSSLTTIANCSTVVVSTTRTNPTNSDNSTSNQAGKMLLPPYTKPTTFRIIPSTLSTRIISLQSSTATTSGSKFPVITVTNLKPTINDSTVQPKIAVKRKLVENNEEPPTKVIIQSTKSLQTQIKPKTQNSKPISSTIQLNKLEIKPTVKYFSSSPIVKKPGALVRFEDGLQMWVNNLKEMTYEDDEPIKSWDLKPETKVVVKYTDGLFYDAEVISSYVGKSTNLGIKKTTMTSQPDKTNPKETTTLQSKNPATKLTEGATKPDIKKDDKDREDGLKEKEQNKLKIKCPNCYLMFGNVMLFRKHQKTVCGCSGITVASDSKKPFSLVEVDESAVPPLVKNYNKENEDKVKNIPRMSDGKRWFRRGTLILHRWQTTNEGSKWYNGKILRLLDSQKGQQTEFEVEYSDEDHGSGPYIVSLYEDYPHDMRIITR